MYKRHNIAVIKTHVIITAIIVAPKLVYIYKSCSIKSNIWRMLHVGKITANMLFVICFFFALGYPS